MKLREALITAGNLLNEKGIDGGRFDAEILLQYILKKDRTFFIREPFTVLSEDEEREYFRLINERASGKPVSYITGEKEFMGIPFKVSEAVLIPRPDTEILVEEAISRLNHITDKRNEDKAEKKNSIRVLDMCTGSGAIAVSLGYYLPEISVIGADISSEALKIAKYNSRLNNTKNNVRFVLSDLFEEISEDCRFEMIVSNPPYIKKADIEGLMKDVKDFEPELALDGGNDGLDFYRRIVPEAELRLKSGGSLLMEIGFDQGEDVSELLRKNGNFEDINVIKDLAGLDRVVAANVNVR